MSEAGTRVDRRTVLVFLGLQLAMVVSPMAGTIVATATPAIVDDLGGLSRVTWVVTAYLLAQVAFMALWGKLGDLHGRRSMLLLSVSIFLGGSLLCAGAQTMDQLLAARFVQGVGGGGIGVVAMALIADIVPARQVGRWLGYQGIVFAVASLVGPVLGGVLVDHLHWRFAFLINVPFCLVSLLLVATQLRLPRRRVEHALDWSGSALLAAALVAFIALSSLGGVEFGWTSTTALALLATAVGLAVAFVLRQRRAPEPVMPPRLFQDRVVRVAALLNWTSGLVFWCAVFFVPLFMQQVRGVSPTSSGLVLVPVMFGAAFGTGIAGRRVERTGHLRAWPIAGAVLMIAGTALLGTLGEGSSALVAATWALLVGTGVGFSMQTSLLAGQNAAAPDDLGAVTAFQLLFRMLGSLMGVPVLGGILNAGLDGRADAAAFADALPPVFLATVPIAVLSLVAALRLPERPLRETVAHADAVVADPIA